MAENQEQKSNKKLSIIKILNKSMLVIVAVLALFLLYQIVTLFTTYSKKDAELFEQGRILNIGVKDNSLEINDIEENEIAQKRAEFYKTKNIDTVEKEPYGPLPQLFPMLEVKIKPEDFVGPMPDKTKVRPEDFVGPMPAEKKIAEEKPVEKKLEKIKKAIVTDPKNYKTANLSIIITEIGPKKDELDYASKELPKEVSFAFSPYADELQKKVDFAMRDGREVMLNIMFNPSEYPVKDGGPLSIQANYDEAQNVAHFVSTLNTAKSYIGVLGIHDEVLTSKFDKLSPLLKKITEKNLFFGFFRTSTNANLENDVKPFATDSFAVDYILDEELDEESIKAKLEILKEDLLIKKRRIVLAVTPNKNSIKILREWLVDNVGTNIQIAPVSYFVTNN